MKKLAYSYLRFSTPRQAKGDSYRRQMEAARKFAEEHGLSLQEATFNDFGISAFKDRNVQSGALGDFLNLVQDGQIQKGAYLLVENHDRLSRVEPEEALHQLQSLVRAGIIVVTLHDGEVYRRGEKDVMRLMKSIIYMERAHNESVIKSKRGKSIWEKRRQDSLQTGNVCRASRLPSWLKWEGEQVVIDEDRAESVRLMFKWCAG
ncbi:recombinase family protein [Photobacterium sanguinicancri]|uniref:Recombinase family protein n=1 Tax=Photobacterium sanguinicancri TaxID=875932 RepID=A0AAW7Y7G3_9GAMM|nr:recombinase family protein [Photobacterium sanguinicancri]MDO6544284.1 recombinase family protein [Photobacterium sanguinicancri]